MHESNRTISSQCSAIRVGELTQVAAARRRAMAVAAELRLDEETCGRAALVATELGTNLVIALEDQGRLFVLDIRMPDILGTEVLARLKRQPDTADIPVIIATLQSIDDAERARLATHAAAILSKNRIGGAAGDAALREALQNAGAEVHAVRGS